MTSIGLDIRNNTLGGHYTSWTKKFNLVKNPFKDTLDSDLFFRTPQHEEALIKILIAIEDCHALALLSGPSGTGKTMVSQMVLRAIDLKKIIPVFVYVYPGMGKTGLLSAILQELEEKKIPRFTAQQLSRLQDIMLSYYEKGQRLVVFIDEAHFLKADALHILRTLSNMENESEKLITALLIAENTLKQRIHSSKYYSSFKSRITFSMELQPLTLDDTEQYIKYRLLKCKAPANLLDAELYETIHILSGGIPRDINRILYNGFMESMAMNNKMITLDILRKVAKKLGIKNG